MEGIGKLLSLAAMGALSLAATASPVRAQISINVGPPPGPPPECPYGYYDFPPYACAPYGYYGPDWFINGVFIGAGPWFHGPRDFHGYVDNRFSPRHGYHGPMPHRGERPGRPLGRMPGFHGNEMHDGHGHVVGGGRGGHGDRGR